MSERVFIGLIVGLVTSVGFWVWYSDFFTKTQKIIILTSLLFPPGAVGVIILISIYNKVTEPIVSNSVTPKSPLIKDMTTLKDSLMKVKELHSKGVFNDMELAEKTSEIERQIEKETQKEVNKSLEYAVKQTEEYKALVVLKSSQVINGEEFDKKVKKLVDDKKIESTSAVSNSPEAKAPTTEHIDRVVVTLIVTGIIVLMLMALYSAYNV